MKTIIKSAACAAAVAALVALSAMAAASRLPDSTDESSAGAVNTTVGAEAESVAGSLDTTPSGMIINVR